MKKGGVSQKEQDYNNENETEKIFISSSLNKKYKILKDLSNCSQKIGNAMRSYEEKLISVAACELSLAQQLSRFYNKESVFRPAMDIICKSLKSVSKAHVVLSKVFDSNSTIISHFEKCYEIIPSLTKSIEKKNSTFTHYVEKLKKLKAEKLEAEMDGGSLTKSKINRLLRNEKKLHSARIEIEKQETIFDEKTDHIFSKRFEPINKVLYDYIREGFNHAEKVFEKFSKMNDVANSLKLEDDFRKYKSKSFGAIDHELTEYLESSKGILLEMVGSHPINELNSSTPCPKSNGNIERKSQPVPQKATQSAVETKTHPFDGFNFEDSSSKKNPVTHDISLDLFDLTGFSTTPVNKVQRSLPPKNDFIDFESSALEDNLMGIKGATINKNDDPFSDLFS